MVPRLPTMCTRPTRPPTSSPEPSPSRYLLGLCLFGVVCAACSYDASKLRRPTSRVQDSAAEYPTPDSATWVKDGPWAAAELGRDGADPEASEPPKPDGPAPELASVGDGGDPVDANIADDDGSAGGSGGSGGTGGAGDPSTGGAGGAGGTPGGEDAGGLSTGGVLGGFDGPEDSPAAGDGVEGVPDLGAADAPDVGPSPMDAVSEVAAVGDVGSSFDPNFDPDLALWYRFDESGGATAFDSAMLGGVARNAMLMTTGPGAMAQFTTTRQVGSHAVALSPPLLGPAPYGGYVVVPALAPLAPDAATIAVWVNLGAATSTQNWERIWDFGDSSTAPRWMNLTARTGSSPNGPVFATSASGHTDARTERLVSPTPLTANVWHHVAIVLSAGTPYTGVMYVDGVAVATNNAMTVHLADIGATANNWIGRSQFTSDPYFNGSFDDFRVYKRALSQQEIAALLTLR